MGYCDGRWTPVVIMVTINSALGLGNALVKKWCTACSCKYGPGFDFALATRAALNGKNTLSAVGLLGLVFGPRKPLGNPRRTRPNLTLNILIQLFFSALVGASLTQYFFLLGLSYTSATLACAFISMTPAITFVMSLIFRAEKLNVKSKAGIGMVMGTLICIGGALLLTMYKGVPLTKFHKEETHLLTNNKHALKPENWIIGCVLLFAGSSCFGSWMLIQSKVNDKYPCQYSSTVILSLFGTVQCALLSLIKSRDITAWILTDKLDIMTIIYAGAVAQGICTVGTSWCIRKRGPIFTSVFTPVGLVFATLFDFSILHRQICIGSVLGSCIVIFGLYIFLLGKVRQMKEEECAKKSPSYFGEEEEREDDEHYKKGHLMVVPMTP